MSESNPILDGGLKPHVDIQLRTGEPAITPRASVARKGRQNTIVPAGDPGPAKSARLTTAAPPLTTAGSCTRLRAPRARRGSDAQRPPTRGERRADDGVSKV